MVSLAYAAPDGLICGKLATQSIHDLQTHAPEAHKPNSLRFHITLSLADSILILATLLCRDLSKIHLHEYRLLYVESFRLGVTMLRDIAASLHTAGRILQDLTNIVNVVEDLQTRPQGSPKPTDFANSVPSNSGDLFQFGFENMNYELLTGIPSPLPDLD